MLREECRFRVFQNRTLMKIFGPKMEKVIADWRELHNEELHDLYCSPNIFGVTNHEGCEWWGMWQVWRRKEICTGVWWRNLMETDRLEHLQVDGRIIIKW